MPTQKIILLKKAHPQKFYATAQNTLSFLFADTKAQPKKNERVFSPTLSENHRTESYL